MIDMIETLRPLFLFAGFTDEQLRWVAGAGEEVSVEPGHRVIAEGMPADAFYVLMEGTVQLTKRVAGREAVFATSSQPGVWVGYLPIGGAGYHIISAHAVTRLRLWRLPAAALDHMLNHGFRVAGHLVAGLYQGTATLQALVRQQEKMSALGRLSAGLAHELNNPAAAARRAASQLREAVDQKQAASLALVE